MKRILSISLLLAALCISTAAFAQKDKVVEASSKRKPAWIGSSDRSHFAVTEVGETLAAASGKCMASIRQYIVNAVAVNVSSAEKMATRQITRDQLVTAMSDYSSALMTEAGQLPYLNNITLSNAEAVYWERIYSKKTKTYRYEYSVLYPFPEQTRRQLIEAFVAIDDAKQAEYERLRRELGTITDIDRIRLAVNELDGLYDYFFDATRKGDVETLRRNYRALYNAVSIEVESEAPGECVYSLRLDGRPATTAVQPRLKSESVLEMAVKPYGDGRYLLSPKDLCTIDLLPQMAEAGVRVFKIEGRARGAEYVHRAVGCYDRALRAMEAGTYTPELVAREKERLAEVFNRGFWNGYYAGAPMVERSDRYGSAATRRKVYVGKVTNFYRKLSVAEVLVEAAPLQVGEDIFFLGPTTGLAAQRLDSLRGPDGNPTATARQGDVCAVRTEQLVRRGDSLYKMVPSDSDLHTAGPAREGDEPPKP